MRKLYSVFIAVIITASVFAQAPEKMNYQAVVRNSSNQLVAVQIVGMRISILQGSATGSAVYVETQAPTTNANGLVTVEIGSGTVVSGTFSAIDWSNGTYFIKTETDPTGGTNYSITGTSQLQSVPYALYAKTAGNGFSGNYNDLTNKPENLVTLVSPPVKGDIIYFNGISWVTLPKGVDGNILTVEADVPVWKNQQAPNLIPASATTLPATNIQVDGATLNGVVNANGLLTKVHFEWGYDTNYGNEIPTSNMNPIDISGSVNTNVNQNISDYSFPNKTIHYRLKVENAVGVTYGQDMSFSSPFGAPTLSDMYLGSINVSASVHCQFEIKSNGGAIITATGLCWSTSPNPTITDNHTMENLTEYNTINSNATGLIPNTNYYIRSYATNNYGTGYGTEMSFNSGYLIGSTYMGGLVFYNDGKGHGLVCASNDQSTGAEWGCVGITIGTKDEWRVVTGNNNTTAILNGCSTPGIAARICDDLSLNGYNDWFLPSSFELYEMYSSLKANDMGNFSSTQYWSSSEGTTPDNSSFYARTVDMNYGNPGASVKNTALYVRAVRVF